ncbi:amino-acid N-acetyltransferase [Pseudomonas sp. F1_0610]|uniref:amino-acid N-acetyltransferase n=1 Tax=Pseudomonas sp. F1_0610 TaxID=3114284 RepID=UPI0039C26824
MHEYVNWLRNASPYINMHRGRTFVIALPGAALAHQNFRNIVHDLVLLHSLGVRLVLVHGARPQIEQRLAQKNIASSFHNALRITDSQTLQCVQEAVGQLRIAIEARFSMDMMSSPMQGAHVQVVGGNFVTAKPIGVVEGVDYQYTGEIRRVNRKAIIEQLDQHNIVLLPSLGYSPTAEVFNLSSVDIATEVAVCLKADKLILFGEDKGLLDEQGQLIRELCPQQAPTHLQRLNEGSDAARQLKAAAQASAHVARCHMISYADNGALLTELFTRDGGGTLIDEQLFEQVREANINDVGGLIELIRPLEEQGILVRRSRDMLEREIERFSIVERDGCIIACAALYPFIEENTGELACLAVNPEYRHGGRGDILLERIEQRARALRLHHLFVLTTRTAHWFQERGFEPCEIEQLPKKKAQLYNFQRNSKVFRKSLGALS